MQVQVSTQDVANEGILRASTETSRYFAILPPISKREGSIRLLRRTDETTGTFSSRTETMSGIPGTLWVGSRSASQRSAQLAIFTGCTFLGQRARLPADSTLLCKPFADVLRNSRHLWIIP